MPRRGPRWGSNDNTLFRIAAALIRALPSALTELEIREQTLMHEQTIRGGLAHLIKSGKVEASESRPETYTFIGKEYEI